MSNIIRQYCHMSKLREAREAAGLTREELGRRAATSTSTVTRMELKGHMPNGATVARIASVLDISPVLLLTPADAPPSSPPGDGGAVKAVA